MPRKSTGKGFSPAKLSPNGPAGASISSPRKKDWKLSAAANRRAARGAAGRQGREGACVS